MNASDVKEGRINDQLGTQLEALSAQVEANLTKSKTALAEWSALLAEKSKVAYRQVDEFARERPWQAVGAALVCGLAAGLLCGRD